MWKPVSFGKPLPVNYIPMFKFDYENHDSRNINSMDIDMDLTMGALFMLFGKGNFFPTATHHLVNPSSLHPSWTFLYGT